MKRIVLASAIGAALLWFASKTLMDDLKHQQVMSNVTTIEHRGVITANIGPSSKVDQVLVGAKASTAAHVYVSFPSGALPVDTEIAIGPAMDRSTEILAEIGNSAEVKTADPVYIGPWQTDSTVEVNRPLTISLPLVHGPSHPALIYVIYAKGVWKAGLMPLTAGKQTFQGFGYFQIIYHSTLQTPKEIISQIRPELSSKDRTR